MPSTCNLLALFLALAIPACEASAPTLTAVSLAGPEGHDCKPVQEKKACRVFLTPASGISGTWTINVLALPKGSSAPDVTDVLFNGLQTTLTDDTQVDDQYAEWVLSNLVDQRKEYDVYYAIKKGGSNGQVVKVTNGECGCPPPPSLKNVKLGTSSCESPKKKICKVTFDVEIAGGLEASVYAIAQKEDAAAPQNYSDFDVFEDKEPDPRVKVQISASGTKTLTRNITNGQNGDYKIYVGGKTKGGWFSNITELPACECPGPGPGTGVLSSGDSDSNEDPPPFPPWAIALIIVAVCLICVIIAVIVMKKKKKKEGKGEKAAGSGENGGVEMSA